ncbi:helix-turn-helix domain-containing protein [Nocardioides zeae]|uniref:Helix-turn-helix domain-containing protein n=1 Tax=Nocardioides imazamoxiresistens TaxID=3231893 RepID=A0ABU3PQV9_9ACTN|nr:helix-turn-helix domain-containing protein [Nocardioides zeae]MDT9591619.1 helix-turn-helix domain-containing protein [Nocardioides zeae]
MPRATAAAAAQTAADVLAAAADLFAERGFAGVSLDDVAERASVTRGAVYHHYRNKAGLLAAVVAEHQEGVAAAVVVAAEAAGADPGDQLRAGCHAFVDAVTAPGVARVLLRDAPAALGWEQWREIDAAHAVVHLREALQAVGVEADLLDATTAQLSGAMNEAALWVAQGAPGQRRRESAHDALDRLLGSVVR